MKNEEASFDGKIENSQLKTTISKLSNDRLTVINDAIRKIDKAKQDNPNLNIEIELFNRIRVQ